MNESNFSTVNFAALPTGGTVPPVVQKGSRLSGRRAEINDLDTCNTLCLRVHGHDRGGELRDAIGQSTAVVVERGGSIRAYATAVVYFGHAVGANNEAIQALISLADAFHGPGILVPTRNEELFRWCLVNGLRIVQPMTLMSTGLYNQPAGSFLPSILL